MSVEAWFSGRKVLVPRAGELGERLAEALRAHGAEPVVAPVIDFRASANPEVLSASLVRLMAGAYDWLAVTSATTVAVLSDAGVTVPPGTRVAAVGAATAKALRDAGFPVDFMPLDDHSAAGMLAEWPAGDGRMLLPQSALAEPTLAQGFEARGLSVDVVEAYATVEVSLDRSVVEMAARGELAAVLLTSGSVARGVRNQLGVLSPNVIVAALGEPTERAARAAGLTVQVRAASNSADALIEALVSWRP